MLEGLDWQTLCRKHGLYGAIENVVAEAKRRYARQDAALGIVRTQ
jgi:hypothetical protein